VHLEPSSLPSSNFLPLHLTLLPLGELSLIHLFTLLATLTLSNSIKRCHFAQLFNLVRRSFVLKRTLSETFKSLPTSTTDVKLNGELHFTAIRAILRENSMNAGRTGREGELHSEEAVLIRDSIL